MSFFKRYHVSMISPRFFGTLKYNTSTGKLLPILDMKCFSTSSKRYIQPRPSSHPYLLEKNDVTFGLNMDIYKTRRTKLFERILNNASSDGAHLVVVPSSTVVHMTDDIPYFFRQNTDFSYLCGFKEPNSVLVLRSKFGSSQPEFDSFLFVPKPTSYSEKWEGPQMTLPEIESFLGVERALYITELETELTSFAKSHKLFKLWYSPVSHCPNSQTHNIIEKFCSHHSKGRTTESPKNIFHQLRLMKSPEELNIIRKSCQIASESLSKVMRFSKPRCHESHLHAKMEFECKIRGADFMAFPSVVAGGSRSNTIHYLDNNQVIEDGEMVLMDTGCDFHGYSSDMTRTWPVNGKFSGPQKELYESILCIQEELINMCKPPISLDELFKSMLKKMAKYWKELGLIPKSLSEMEASQAAHELCPHHVSHYLGMDVHDTSQISRSIPVKQGMVVTVEPGIYIPENKKDVPPEFRGLGIRIEDDLIITEHGNEILTSTCPKQVSEIEKHLSV